MTAHVAGCRCHDCYLMRSAAAAARIAARTAVPSLPACDCGQPATMAPESLGPICDACLEQERIEGELRGRDYESWSRL